ncbi:MAG TPA: SCO family protein [Myxococcaceae bacterium]|nr:SCO family protein [Myxococcaceae bacterium]
MSTQPPEASRYTWLLRRPAPWAALISAIVLVVVLVTRPGQSAPEALGTLPTYSFTSEQGVPFGTEELTGRVYVANFIFTRCPTICPRFSEKMARIQSALADQRGIHLVSFSVDPEFDTPEVLREYSERYRADPTRWTFLTGDYEQLRETVVGGFKIAMGNEAPEEDDVMSIFHGEHFVIVDQRGEIRGYVHANEEDVVEQVSALALRLRDA